MQYHSDLESRVCVPCVSKSRVRRAGVYSDLCMPARLQNVKCKSANLARETVVNLLAFGVFCFAYSIADTVWVSTQFERSCLSSNLEARQTGLELESEISVEGQAAPEISPWPVSRHPRPLPRHATEEFVKRGCP